MQHFYAQAGIFHFLDSDISYLELAGWAKYVEGAPINVNVNFRYQTGSAIYVGLGGSTAGSVHAETGVLIGENAGFNSCLLYTSPSPRDRTRSRMPSSA